MDDKYYLDYEQRTADNWPEALQKQARLMAEYVNEYDDGYFSSCVDACRRAVEIWREVEGSRQSEIEALQKQLATIQDEIREAVAKQLADENKSRGWWFVAQAIEENTDLDSWLNW